jgi:hypothetical protein
MSFKLVVGMFLTSAVFLGSVAHATGQRTAVRRGPLGAASHSRVLYSAKDITMNGRQVPGAREIAIQANGGRVSPLDIKLETAK